MSAPSDNKPEKPYAQGSADGSISAKVATASQRHFAFLLIDHFPMLCLASAIDPLRSANRATGKDLYKWTFLSIDGNPVEASNGMVVEAAGSLDTEGEFDIIFVCAGLKIEVPNQKHMLAELRARARRGSAMGALSVGSYFLGNAGLLDNYRCTIHWESRAPFENAFPKADCTGRVFEIDRNRYTCAGGTTSIDLMLQIIEEDFDAQIATEVANQYQHERIRSNADRQRVGPERNLSGKSERLRQIVELMADNLEEPISASRLAKSVNLSLRQVERLFLKYLNQTPGRYYMALRLERARELLRQTNAPILDVALATGFTSHSYFAQSYKNHFGHSPSVERREN